MIVKDVKFEEVENLEYDTYVNFITSIPYYMVEALYTGENIGLASFRKMIINLDTFNLVIEVMNPDFRFCTLSINGEVKRSILSITPEEVETPFSGRIYNDKGKPSLVLYSSGDRPSTWPLASLNIDLFMKEGVTYKEPFNGFIITYKDDDIEDNTITVVERYPIVLKHWPVKPVTKEGYNDGFVIKVKGVFLNE